jgi:hypothetical protein
MGKRKKHNLNLWAIDNIEFGYTLNSIIIVILLIFFLYFYNFFQ